MKKLWRTLASTLDTIGRRRMIYRGENENYLERFYILSTPWIGVYLHKFWSDDDETFHCHPWSSISVLLSGSYKEEVPIQQTVPYLILASSKIAGFTEIKIRKPFRPLFHFRKATDCHRITLAKGEETWSLFIRFRRKREWGFWQNGVWKRAEVQSRKELKNV